MVAAMVQSGPQWVVWLRNGGSALNSFSDSPLSERPANANFIRAPPPAAGTDEVLMSISTNPPSVESLAIKPEPGSPVPAILMAVVLVALIVLAWSGVTPTVAWAQG